MKQLLTLLALLSLTACARFHTAQTDINYDQGKPSHQTTTKAGSITFFDSKSQLANFKAHQTDKSQSATVGSLSQEAYGTNAVAALEAINRILLNLRPSP